MEFSVWPNPVRKGEAVNISLTGQYATSGEWKATIYDLEGRKVAEKRIDSGATVRCDMVPGTYIVNITDGTSKAVGKGRKIVVNY